MNRRLRYRPLLLAAVMAIAFLQPVPSSAESEAETNNQGRSYTSETVELGASMQDGVAVENLKLVSEDLTVRGVSNRNDIFFEVGESRNVLEGSFIELQYAHSPTLLPKRSTVTVLIDDIPLGSEFLDEGNMNRTAWRLDLSDIVLRPGFHKISVVTHMEVTSNICDDQNNEANWMRVYKDSLIHLKMSHAYDAADLSVFPSPFFEIGSQDPLHASLVLPDSPNAEELAVMMQLSQYFNIAAAGKPFPIQAYRESDLTPSLLKQNLIWIGSSDRWSGPGSKLPVEEAGTISINPSPWDTDNVVLSIEAEGADLLHAGRMLTNEKLRDQLFGGSVNIADVKLSPDFDENANLLGTGSTKQHVTFEEMGYNDITIESSLVGGTRVVYNIPTGWELNSGAKLHLKFKHSKILNFAQSVAAVKVNGVPVGSERLNEVSSDLGSMDIDLDPDVLGQGSSIVIDMTFQFSSNAAKDACTGGNAQIGNWAVIQNDSFLSFTYEPHRSFNLALLPAPLNQPWSSTTVLLGDRPSKEELTLLADMVGRFAQSQETAATPNIAFVGEQDLRERMKDRNLIFIGDAESIPDWLNEQEEAVVSYRDGELQANVESVQLLEHVKQRSAWLQLTRSPLNEEMSCLLIAATDSALMPIVSEIMADPRQRSKIQGNLSVIDERAGVHSFMTVKEEAPMLSLSERIEGWLSLNNKDVLQKVILIASFLAALSLLGFALWYWRRRP